MTDEPEAADPIELPAKRKRTFWTDRRISLMVFAVVAIVCGFETVRFVNAMHTRSKIDATAEVLNIVRDTVDPGGKRYARNQENQLDILDLLIETKKAAASSAVYCAQRFDELVPIAKCVDEQFAKLYPMPTTTTLVAGVTAP